MLPASASCQDGLAHIRSHMLDVNWTHPMHPPPSSGVVGALGSAQYVVSLQAGRRVVPPSWPSLQPWQLRSPPIATVIATVIHCRPLRMPTCQTSSRFRPGILALWIAPAPWLTNQPYLLALPTCFTNLPYPSLLTCLANLPYQPS